MKTYSLRLLAEFLLLLTIPVGVAHMIPSGFELRHSFNVMGTPALEPLPTEELIRVVTNTLNGHATCKLTDQEQILACQVRTRSRKRADEISRGLGREVSHQIGWVDPHVLESRIVDTNQKISNYEGELDQLYVEFNRLRETRGVDQKRFEEISAEVVVLKQKLANREKQLELIAEALTEKRSPEQMALFSKKKSEIESSIPRQEEKIAEAAKNQEFAAAPLERWKDLEGEIEAAENKIGQGHASIARWSASLPILPQTTKIPDPDFFQLRPASDPPRILALRSWGHLIWSIPLGLLFFGLLQLYRFIAQREVVFHSAHQVEKVTGLRLLAEFPSQGS